MGKGKLQKFAEMATMRNVFEFPYNYDSAAECDIKGQWHTEVFANDNPIVLELGCGRGEYTVGLARTHTHKNYIGVDIKGARMWTGAKMALAEDLHNAAFLRTNIEIIDRFFAPNEVSEIWLTFSDPQMKKATKRLSSTYFLRRYAHFLQPDGIVHLKTDSNFLFTYTEELLKANGIQPLISTRNLYDLTTVVANNDATAQQETLLTEARMIQTYYEDMWRSRGIDIKYLAFRLPSDTDSLTEPEAEIELDEYRSYNRSKRSGSDTHK